MHSPGPQCLRKQHNVSIISTSNLKGYSRRSSLPRARKNGRINVAPVQAFFGLFSKKDAGGTATAVLPAYSPAIDQLLEAIEGTERGLSTSAEKQEQIDAAIAILEEAGKGSVTSGESLTATWRLVWTTEKVQEKVLMQPFPQLYILTLPKTVYNVSHTNIEAGNVIRSICLRWGMVWDFGQMIWNPGIRQNAEVLRCLIAGNPFHLEECRLVWNKGRRCLPGSPLPRVLRGRGMQSCKCICPGLQPQPSLPPLV